MNTRAIPFARHVHEALSPYRWGISIVASLLVAVLFAGFALRTRASSTQQLLTGLSPYLATLVESQDRPEILRVLQSVSENQGGDFVLVQSGDVLASTRAISEMDQSFIAPTYVASLFGSTFTNHQIVSRAGISRQGGPPTHAVIYCFSPLGPTLFSALAILLASFLSSLLVSLILAKRMKSAIQGALVPLDQLHREIQGMSDDRTSSTDPLPIQELEEIRRTISGAKVDLANTRERLAEERAKQLSARAYKQLIHDLHNPTAALRQWIRILSDPETDAEDREEATETVPRIADQIMRQVSAAKMNLEDQPAALRESDLRSCLKSSFQQIRSVSGIAEKGHVTLDLPNYPIVVAHDPDLLQRAVVNLLENGIEASREKVEISLEQVGHQALIRVSDDGDGMDESMLSLFLQGRGRSNKADRDALGLSSANHIVRTHGGKIVYLKSPLGGAAFEIRLEAQ